MFSLKAEVASQWVGESPKGDRVDIQYRSGDVTTDASEYVADWWTNLTATQKRDLGTLFKKCEVEWPKANSKDTGILESVVEFRTMDPSETSDAAKDAVTKTLGSLRGGGVTPLAWFGFTGKVVSGSDWATLRPDLVAEFSGRLTIESADDDEALIDAVFTGIVDLSTGPPTGPISDPRRASLDAWNRGQANRRQQILLAVTFDVGKAAQKWAPKRYGRQAEGYWKYQRLTQGQFVAIGDVSLANGAKKLQIDEVDLSIYEVRPGQ